MNADFDFQSIRTSRINRTSRTSRVGTSRASHMTSHGPAAGTDFEAGPGTGFGTGFGTAGFRDGFESGMTAHFTDGVTTDVEADVEADIEAANRRRAVRSTLIVSALGAVAVAAAFMSPSAASGAAPAPVATTAAVRSAAADLPAPVSGSPSSAFTRIADFYGAYIDAVSSEGSGEFGGRLRAFYLTKKLRQTLAGWEAANHADGVLRAQNTPLSWTVTSDGSGAGHTWAIVTLTWSAGHTTRLHVQADLDTKLISDIKPLAAN